MNVMSDVCYSLFLQAAINYSSIYVSEHPQGPYPSGEFQAIFLHALIHEGLRRAVKQTVIHQVGLHSPIHLPLLTYD